MDTSTGRSTTDTMAPPRPVFNGSIGERRQSLLGPPPSHLPRNPAIKIGTGAPPSNVTRTGTHHQAPQPSTSSSFGGRTQIGSGREIPSLLSQNFNPPSMSSGFRLPRHSMPVIGAPQQQQGAQGQGNRGQQMSQAYGDVGGQQGGQGAQRAPPGSAADLYRRQLEQYYTAHYAQQLTSAGRGQQMMAGQQLGTGGLLRAGFGGSHPNLVRISLMLRTLDY